MPLVVVLVWHTTHASPREVVFASACEEVDKSAWQPVHAAVIAGAGLMYACGFVVEFRPSGRFCSLLLTWHIEQLAVSVGVPCGLIAGYRTVVKSFTLP